MVRPYAVESSFSYADYLELEQAEKAYWMGEGAKRLGLSGAVDPEQFKLLEKGIDPVTGEVLRPRQRHSLTHNGKEYAHTRNVYDVVVMAPKSVSVAGLVDERVIEAHKEAVRSIQTAIELCAQVRVRKGEAHETNSTRETQNIVGGVWRHENSRELDPLTHSHACLVNMSYDPVEQKWKALQAVEIYRHRWELSEQYRHALAQRLIVYGYDLAPRELSEHRYPKQLISEREWGFEIAGVSPEVVTKMSQRTDQRDAAIERYQRKHGEYPDERIITELVRQNREPKEPYTETERQVIREAQLARLTPAEHTQLLDLKDQALERQQIYERVAPTPEAETPKERRKLSLRDGVHSEPDLKHEEWNYGETPSYRAGYKVRP